MAAIPFPQGKNHKTLNLCTAGYASTHFYQMLTRTLDHELTILDFESTFYGCIWPNFKQFSYGRYKVKGKGSKSPKKPKQLRKTQALSTCSREPLTYLAPGNTFSILVKPCVVAAGAHHTSSCSTIILFYMWDIVQCGKRGTIETGCWGISRDKMFIWVVASRGCQSILFSWKFLALLDDSKI